MSSLNMEICSSDKMWITKSYFFLLKKCNIVNCSFSLSQVLELILFFVWLYWRIFFHATAQIKLAGVSCTIARLPSKINCRCCLIIETEHFTNMSIQTVGMSLLQKGSIDWHRSGANNLISKPLMPPAQRISSQNLTQGSTVPRRTK